MGTSASWNPQGLSRGGFAFNSSSSSSSLFGLGFFVPVFRSAILFLFCLLSDWFLCIYLLSVVFLCICTVPMFCLFSVSFLCTSTVFVLPVYCSDSVCLHSFCLTCLVFRVFLQFLCCVCVFVPAL